MYVPLLVFMTDGAASDMEERLLKQMQVLRTEFPDLQSYFIFYDVDKLETGKAAFEKMAATVNGKFMRAGDKISLTQIFKEAAKAVTDSG